MIYVEKKLKDTSEKQDLKKIWKCLKTECFVYFPKRQLKALWEEFSEEQYFAGFIIPSFGVIEQFINWLWLKSRKGILKIEDEEI